jgi:NADH-quinone oxidoreductase subunit N
MAFLPESILLAGALALFFVSLGRERIRLARAVALGTAVLATAAAAFSLDRQDVLFDGAYRVDAFSQILKLAFAAGFAAVVLMKGRLPDIQEDLRPEYYFFVAVSISGLMLLVSSIDVISLVVALELSAFPLYVMVAMRREREGQRSQMESAIKYIMFGVASNGIMLFGLSYLFGLTGTTSLTEMMPRLHALPGSPVIFIGLAMALCGLFYKLAVFPFHFWTPDVYQGASNETAGLVASLPKIGAVAVLVRFVSLASPGNPALVVFLAVLAGASMFYGNLVALMQGDLKRLLGFSGIAHAGYTLLGFVAMDRDGFSASLFYIFAYALMVIACFVAVCRVSPDGTNVAMGDLAGLHRRSPLLALTLGVGVFALAGIPPFAGFTGKLALLKAALAQGHLALVVIAVVNTVIAIYYYLAMVRETYFRDPGDRPAIAVDLPTRILCIVLILGILVMGILPEPLLAAIRMSL